MVWPIPLGADRVEVVDPARCFTLIQLFEARAGYDVIGAQFIRNPTAYRCRKDLRDKDMCHTRSHDAALFFSDVLLGSVFVGWRTSP